MDSDKRKTTKHEKEKLNKLKHNWKTTSFKVTVY